MNECFNTLMTRCYGRGTKNHGNAVGILQSDAVKIMDWFDNNHIKVDVYQTQLMCFRNSLKAAQANIPFILHSYNCFECDCTSQEYVNSTKYLGVYFDCDLS